MAKAKLTDVTGKIVDLLTPLESDERKRIFQAAFLLLGDTAVRDFANSNRDNSVNDGNNNFELDDHNARFSQKAKTWMKHHSVTADQISQVFHISNGTVEVIASKIPGKSRKEQTVNAYVLQGIAKFLLSGEPNFDDDSARSFCQTAGCYDLKNHSKYLDSKGNKFTGTKATGWTLTTPGLKDGADLVKQASQ